VLLVNFVILPLFTFFLAHGTDSKILFSSRLLVVVSTRNIYKVETG